jgi:hypothetical protein
VLPLVVKGSPLLTRSSVAETAAAAAMTDSATFPAVKKEVLALDLLLTAGFSLPVTKRLFEFAIPIFLVKGFLNLC